MKHNWLPILFFTMSCISALISALAMYNYAFKGHTYAIIPAGLLAIMTATLIFLGMHFYREK